MRAPLPPVGKTPGPGTVGPPPRTRKMALGLTIRQSVATLELGGWRSGKRAAGPGTQKAAALREEGNTGHPATFC
jgi:hypothetical protein